jgi:hypothetical protein
LGAEGLIGRANKEIEAAQRGEELTSVFNVADFVGGNQSSNGTKLVNDAVFMSAALVEVALERQNQCREDG